MEGNLLNLGGFSVNAVKVEVNLGSRAQEGPDGLHIPLRELTTAPTMLACLSWHTRASAFVGREAELESLKTWCEHPAPISLRFVVGAGGSGKSRLAAELALAVRKRRWVAGFLDLAVDRLAAQAATRDSLLVVDYPEDSSDGLKRFLRGLARIEAKRKIRVLCLCRSMPGAWRDLVGSAGITEFHEGEATVLGGIAVDAAYELLCSASEKISGVLDTAPPPVSVELFEHWYARDPAHANPLYVLAAAAHMSFEPGDLFLRFDGRTAVTGLVRRELDRLRKLATDKGLRETAYTDLVVASLIQDGLVWEQVPDLCRRLPEPLALDADDRVIEAISREDRHGILRLDVPDIVAACLIAAALRMTGDPTELVWTAMTLRPPPMERFARLAADAQAVLRDSSSPLVDAAIRHLAQEDRYASYYAVFGRYRLAALDPVLWPLWEAIWRKRARATIDPAERGGSLNNLAQALSDQGRHAEATAILEDARIAIRAVPDKRLRKEELAGIHVNMGRALIALHKPLRAMKHLREAIELQGRASAIDPLDRTALRHWLGEETLWLAWDNMGRARTDVGDLAGALRAFEVALDILAGVRSVVRGYPASWAEHAVTVNLATAKARVGDPAGALRILAGQETILRDNQVANGSPDRALLLNLVNQLGIVNHCLASGEANEALADPLEYLAKANELVDLADKLLGVVGLPVWQLAYGGRVGRSELLQRLGPADEFEDATAELCTFLARWTGQSESVRTYVDLAASVARSVQSRMGVVEARDRYRRLIGDGEEAESAWDRATG